MADSNIVKWFWQAVETFDEERRARLLQFVTGSTRVPLQGFKALQGSTGAAGPRLFTIHLIDANTDNLPKAHTCFNRIDIPPYESYEKLYEKLLTAVEETCGFAVEWKSNQRKQMLAHGPPNQKLEEACCELPAKLSEAPEL